MRTQHEKENSGRRVLNRTEVPFAPKFRFTHGGHIVRFYEDDQELVHSILSFTVPALQNAEGVILIATRAHLTTFEEALSRADLDIPSLTATKQLVFLDAAEMLEKFIIDGIPDPAKFYEVIGSAIDEVASVYSSVNAYGEMVGILWETGNSEGMILLEQLWNDLAKVKSFTLLCGYGTSQFEEPSHGLLFQQVCKEHTHVIPAGRTGAEGYSGGHYRVIAELQQREKALRHEIEERKRIESELRQSQSDLNDFFDNAVVGLHWVGPDGTILRANRAELDLLGYEETEYVGRNIAEFHADDNVIGEILDRLSCGQTVKDFSARLKCKDGSIKHVLIDSNAFFQDGRFKHTRCFTRDVTSQYETKEALAKSEILKDAILDSSEDCIAVLGLDARIQYMNSGGLRKLGLADFNSLRGQIWFDLWKDEKSVQRAKEVYHSAVSGKTAHFMGELLNEDGKSSTVWSVVAAPIRNTEGMVSQLLVTSRDVTEQVRAQNAVLDQIKSSESKLDQIFNASPATLSLMVGPDLILEKANRKFFEVTGFALSVIGKSARELYGNIDGGRLVRLLERVYASGDSYSEKEAPIEIRDEEGKSTVIFIDFIFQPLKDDRGRVYGIVSQSFDVSEKVEARKVIERSEERMRFALHAAKMGAYEIDLQAQTFAPGHTAEEIFGHSGLSGDLKSAVQKVVHPDDFDKTLKNTFDAIRLHQPYSDEFRVIKRDGSVCWLQSQGEAKYNESGEPISFYGVIQDVTIRKRAEEELRKAKEEAERANHLKSSFLANMSHEIRTPLGAILGFTDLLKDPSLSREEHSNYLGIVTRNGQQLAEIINDILDLSKVEAGHLTLEFTDTKPEEVAADIVSLLRVKANAKDLVLEFIPDRSMPETIVTDGLRLRQILINIVGNAIKFTQAGSVKVRCFSDLDSVTGETRLLFEITDTGVGIPHSQYEKIFDAFVQADGTLSRKFGGTGLGLALSRKLARSLGGDVIIVKSAEDKGTTFLVSVLDQPKLKNQKAEDQSNQNGAREIPQDALEGVHVLTVDDSADNRQLIWHLLAKFGAATDFAENGLTGYGKALAGDYDIVLMDIQMPEMDGYSATQKLRDAGYGKPIIALTAHAMSEVRKKCLNVGCTDYLAKPIKPKELIAAVAKYAKPNTQAD